VGEAMLPCDTMKHLARDLRRLATPTEQLLWNCLRKNRVSGFRFRRQQIIDRYIVDFCCFEKRLIIELDGSVHDYPERIQRDTVRQQYLEDCGFRVIRFTAQDVEKNLDAVLQVIRLYLVDSPHPSPPPQRGEGILGVQDCIKSSLFNPERSASISSTLIHRFFSSFIFSHLRNTGKR
jgi:very-short-patch-repair endonuclease